MAIAKRVASTSGNMGHRNDTETVECIFTFIRNNNVHDDLLSIKKLHNLIRKDNIPLKLTLFDDDKNIYLSLCCIISNKLKIYIHQLQNHNDSTVIGNFIATNKLSEDKTYNNYVKNYDMFSIPMCYLAIEHFLRSLSICFMRLRKKDRELFFTHLSNVSSLLSLQGSENFSSSHANHNIFNEAFHLVIIKYVKNLFVYIYPPDVYEKLDENDITNIDMVVKRIEYDENKEETKHLVIFLCLTNIMKIILKNVVNKNKKIKLKSLKLLYIILKKIENCHIIKKLFKGISLNLFLLYKSFYTSNIRISILRVLSLCLEKVLTHYSGKKDLFTGIYLKNEWEENFKIDSLVEDEKEKDKFFHFLKGKINSVTAKADGVSSKDGVRGTDGAGSPTATMRREMLFEREKTNISVEEGRKQTDSEDKQIISNVYFIFYYVLMTYDDREHDEHGEVLSEALNLCRIISKFHSILNKNLVLMSFIFVLSQLFCDKGVTCAYFCLCSSMSRIRLLFGDGVENFLEDKQINADALDGVIAVLKSFITIGGCGKSNCNFHSNDATTHSRQNLCRSGDCPRTRNFREGYSPIQSRVWFQNDLHAIFLNLLKLLKQKENDACLHPNGIDRYTLESLNYSIENHYFKHLFNIFSFKRQDNIFLLKFVKGYIYYNFMRNNIKEGSIHQTFPIQDYLLCLYETCDFPCIKNEAFISIFKTTNVLNEDIDHYFLNMYERDNASEDNMKDEMPFKSNGNFEIFRNVKDGFKLQHIRLKKSGEMRRGLINDISIFFFLFCPKDDVENYLEEILFSRWDNGKNDEEAIRRKDKYVLENKWWTDVYHFTDSVDSSDSIEPSDMEKGFNTDEQGSDLNGDECTSVGGREPMLEDKYKYLHFVNYYLDSIIILLCVQLRLDVHKYRTCSTYSVRENMEVQKNHEFYEKALNNELVRTVLSEYANIYTYYFALALKIKFTQWKLHPRKTLEKIMLFLSSKRAQRAAQPKNALKILHQTSNQSEARVHYYTSLLMICIHKCFCAFYLCAYEDIIQDYVYKNIVFFLLNMSSPSSYARGVAEITLSNVHQYIVQLSKKKTLNSDGNTKHSKQIICVSSSTEKWNVPCDIANIIYTYNDIITSYIYDKIIHIDSVSKCEKLFKFVQFLVVHHYDNVCIYKDICIHIIMYTKKVIFTYLPGKTKIELVTHILNMFNYVLYSFYKHIIKKRMEICIKDGYMPRIKRLLFRGHVCINMNRLKGGSMDGIMDGIMDGSEDGNEDGSEDESEHHAVHEITNVACKADGKNNVHINSPDLFRKNGKKKHSACIVRKNENEKKKRELCMHNFLFFKFYRDLFSTDYLEIIKSEHLKEEYVKRVDEFMENILSEVRRNIRHERVVNALVDDDFYDLHVEKRAGEVLHGDVDGKIFHGEINKNIGVDIGFDDQGDPSNWLYDNKHFRGANYNETVHYAHIRYTTSHVFNFSKGFLCHESLHLRFSAHLCALRCLFIFSTRLFELYPTIHQLWGYININLAKNTYMNEIVLLKIVNYITTIDNRFSVGRILSDVFPHVLHRINSLKFKNNMPRHSYEYKFLQNAMLFFLNMSREEIYFEETHSHVLYICFMFLHRETDEQIKKIALNVICNMFLNDIPKIRGGIERIRMVKERIKLLYDEGISEKDLVMSIFSKGVVTDMSIAKSLCFLTCFFKRENTKDIISMILHIDHNILNLLILYFEYITKKYKYKCPLNQHSLIVFNHFKKVG
ncbi:conserved Plasmodium protein, unknown function [Plasmodium ovale]|uniref:TTI1 C-terminal TPR domain-containing protein n=1 Tax=Plasmodium ovale TaxID=36330 RepID=A0A1D3KWY1_PLAOA|nr:conserved Plasmodium protein, unknown function [Plasmodium ovale]